MDIDPTETIRRRMIAVGQAERDLESNVGPTWDTLALRQDFEVLGFQAPFVVVRRKTDGQLGSLEFTNSPRIYFGWEPND